MKKSFVRGVLAAGALVASTIAPSVASAATVLFNLASLGTNSGAFATQSVGGVNVRVSAWSLSGVSGASGTLTAATLGSYGTNGLGATSTGENGGNNTHTVDNEINRDFLVFQFDQQVSLTSALFTAFSLPSNANIFDTDFTVGSGTTATAWTSTLALGGLTYAQLSTQFSNGIASYAGAASVSSATPAASQLLNPLNKYGNVWFVGASFANPDTKFDAFKLSNINAVTAPVPEASTWMMMIAGFGVVGASLRRKRAGLAQLA
jgi:PEP-CTERM motif